MGGNAGPLMQSRGVKQILVLELWNIGDVVLTLPFLEQLHLIFPNAKITLVARTYARELLGPSGLVDEFIETDLGWKKSEVKWNPLGYRWRELWRLARKLRRRRFDLAFQCRPHVREYIILALSGARRRVGMGMPGWDRLLTDRLPIDVFAEQKKESWLRLLRPFGGSVQAHGKKLVASSSARHWAGRFLAAHGVSTEDVLIGVHPGASVPEKRWPLERFAEVIRGLVGRPQVRVLLFVDPWDYGSSLNADDGRIMAKVSLSELVALLEACDVLVCNDSGPMHIAGAVGVPCVAVFSAGIEHMFGPLGEGHHLVSPKTASLAKGVPVGRPNPYQVTEVSTERVLDAIEHAIG